MVKSSQGRDKGGAKKLVVTSPFLKRLHLDKQYLLLTGRAVQLVKQLFDNLDVRGHGELDDISFEAFLTHCTNLTVSEIDKVFDMFDVDNSGSIEFDEFYLLVCMLIAIKDHGEKQFLWRHSRTCFELLDEDGSNAVSMEEFETFGFIFNISKRASRKIFRDFDVDDSRELDYEEFRMFTLACLDKQKEIDAAGIAESDGEDRSSAGGRINARSSVVDMEAVDVPVALDRCAIL